MSAVTKRRGYACAILYKKDGTILLQHRTEDAPTNPGFWACFGGAMEEGETPLETVVRELLEELEYQLRAPELFNAHEYVAGDGTPVDSHEFIEEYDESQSLVLHEGQGMGWFTPDEALATLKLTERRRRTIQQVREILQNLLAA